MSEEVIVVDTKTLDQVAQGVIVAKILESRDHTLTGIDLETEGGKALATMYDRGVSDALTATTQVGRIVVPLVGDAEDDTPVDQDVTGVQLVDTFWAAVNS